jgi:hypothetical protein
MKPFPALRNRQPEDEVLLATSRQEFLPRHRALLDQALSRKPVSWDTIYSTAASHGVAPLAWSNLRSYPELVDRIPGHVRAQFNRCTQRNIALKAMFVEKARSILQFFARRSIPVMLVKGFALDLTVYEQPWFTLCSDLDVMVRCRQEDLSAADRMTVANLVRGDTALERRIAVEFEWFGHHDVSMNGLLPVNFEEMWDRARPVQVLDQAALVMSPEHMLLAACINSCRKRFTRVKALCDVNEIIRVFRINWNEMALTAREWRCENIAYAALLVTAMTLECPLPMAALDTLGVSPARRRVIGYLSRNVSFSGPPPAPAGMNRRGQPPGMSLLLPWAVYSWGQFLRNLAIAWRDRRVRLGMMRSESCP